MEKTIPQLASELISDFKEKITSVKELDLKTWNGVYSLVFLVVRFVENLENNKEIIKENKRSLAVEILKQLTNIEYHHYIAFFVDQAVTVLNLAIGKIWIERSK